MASTVTLSNGQRIWMDVDTGEVIESSQTQVTSITQGSSTVLSHGNSATVIPGRISSRTDVASELWLRMPNGQEQSFQLANLQVPVRPGHRVSVLWGAPAGHDTGWYFGVRNHTTGKSNVDLLGALGSTLKTWKLKVGGGLELLGLFVICMLLGALITFMKTEGPDRAGFAVVGALLGFGAAVLLSPFVRQMVVGPRAKRLVDEVERFAQERLAEHDSPSLPARPSLDA